MILYLDTSALVKLFLDEEGRDVVFASVEAATSVATSVITYPEARSAFTRRRREGDLADAEFELLISSLNDTWKTFTHILVSESLARRAGSHANEYALRGFDAVRLASAVVLRSVSEELAFLAFDRQLLRASREAGLKTLVK